MRSGNVWTNSQRRLQTKLAQSRRRSFRPPPKLTVSEWADQFRQLPSESAAEPGQWRTDRAPYQRGIMDALSDPNCDEVVVMKSAQVGYSEILLNAIGYYSHQEPAPMLMVQPTLNMAHSFSRNRVSTTIRDTPVLRDRYGAPRSKSGENTLLEKHFQGGVLTMTGSNSESELASRPIRILLLDEVDKYKLTKAGDAITLAKKRTRTFWNRKILVGSTPTVKGASRVDAEFQKSDQRKYYVPCPHCGEMEPFEFKDFHFSGGIGTPEDPVWTCRHCGGMATESDKMDMIRGGEWRATAEFTGIAGFHIWEAYSPWSTWATIVKEFLQAKGDPGELQAWTNETLGETWELTGDQVDADSLAKHAELYQAEVPMGVDLLTAGVDIQADRFEVHVWGWNENRERWFIHREIIEADTATRSEWKRLDDYLRYAEFEHQTGTMLSIVATAVDSGYLTDDVYRFCANKAGRRIWAIKGVEGPGRPRVAVMAKPKTPGPKPKRMYSIGVDTLKGELFSDWSTEDREPLFHFPVGLDQEFYNQLTAEEWASRMRAGFRIRYWKKIRERNEAWDCYVYSLAALYILRPVWKAIKKPTGPEPEIETAPVPEQAKRPKRGGRRRGSFATNWKR